MQVEITCRHGRISESAHDLMVEKSEKLTTYFERVTAIQVTVDFENSDRVKVELLVDAEHKHNFVSQDIGENVVSTFESALHKMEQQIRRYKQKIQDHRRDLPLKDVAAPPDEEEE